MFSISTASCNSPRPATEITSGVSVVLTLIETLPRTSLNNRSLKWRLVKYVPSRPAYGDVFTPKLIRKTGSSTSSRGSGPAFSSAAIVSPTSTSSIPAKINRSPADTSLTSSRLIPRNANRVEIRRLINGAGLVAFGCCQTVIVSPLRKTPACTRPMANRPR